MQNNLQKPTQIMTLCILRKGDELLLGMKKVRFGAGNYNGYGGKVDEGESIEQALVREMKEESRLELLKYELRGRMKFELTDSFKEVHIYEGLDWVGDLIETDEMAPFWFNISDIPYEKMWKSDVSWYPYFLKREYFEGETIFDENYSVLSCKIEKIG
jgi:ADP-ribose pyrophosphatase YjhB (NUDIX family)